MSDDIKEDQDGDIEAGYFENYQIQPGDLETLGRDIDELVESELVDASVLDEVRYVTHDSGFLYVFTRGQHEPNDRFKVEELPSASTTGFKIFKIPHSGFIGKKREDYIGATAWLLCDEVESTAVNARKFPNENVLYQPELSQPDHVLDVISISPFTAYKKAQTGPYNYKTDMVFHEAGHIEQRRFENWQIGEPNISIFPTGAQREKFLAGLRRAICFPSGLTDELAPELTVRAIAEMYAMLIDREGAKHFDPVHYGVQGTRDKALAVQIQGQSLQELFGKKGKTWPPGPHFIGALLVSMLESVFPDFADRKKFVRDCLDPKPRP
jgi:hypothetical protein